MGAFQTPDRILRDLLKLLPDDFTRGLGESEQDIIDLLAGALDPNATPEQNQAAFESLFPSGPGFSGENQALLDAILSGNFPTTAGTAEGGEGGAGIGGEIQPTFEELFQESLEEVLGPDPFATFQNIFSDILAGTADTPLETFILSQFQDQLSRFTTAARAAAEQGQPLPIFEEFLQFNRPDLERRFEFTDPGKVQALDQILNLTGGVDTPLNRFIVGNFDKIFRDFVSEADRLERAGEGALEFPDFFTDISGSLQQQFQFTEAGARESFLDVQRLREGAQIAESPFERYIGQNFRDIFSEFQRSDQTKVSSFGDFLGQNEARLRTEFAALSPFERGQFSSVGDKRPVRIQP